MKQSRIAGFFDALARALDALLTDTLSAFASCGALLGADAGVLDIDKQDPRT